MIFYPVSCQVDETQDRYVYTPYTYGLNVRVHIIYVILHLFYIVNIR